MAIQKITYSDKSYINENASIAATNKVQADDMNEIKSVVNNNADLIYPVGTIITTNTNTNPSTTYGGTWASVECPLVIERGDIVSGSPTNVAYGKYKIFANGDFEAWGFTNAMTINGSSTVSETITLPYNVSASSIVSGIAYGGGNWYTCNVYAYNGAGTNTITMAITNNSATAATNFQASFSLKGYVNLENNSIATKYCWRRVS